MSRELLEQAHSLLKRQLKRHAAPLERLEEPWRLLLESVDRAYREFDEDRRMLERALDLSSQELLSANAELRALLAERDHTQEALKSAHAELELRVGERTARLTEVNQQLTREIDERLQVEASLRESQERLLHAQKMEAIGLLAGGVAHDFNNLLTVISGYCEMMLRDSRRDDPRRELLQQVDLAAAHAGSLTRQLLAFSRRQMMQPQVMSLNQAVTGLERMIRRLMGEDIELHTVIDPQLPAVLADPSQIEQVLLNLVVNARDAMPQGGRLTLETASLAPGDPALPPTARAKPHVRLSVADTGCGMAAEVKARIFEPFFTTKIVGKGTGLGLSTVYGIVDQSGGVITVDSTVGEGTRFHIYLPATAAEVMAPNTLPGRGEAPRGTETLLLVEDDGPVRRLLRRLLEDLGYRVLEAAAPAEAAILFNRQPDSVDLLVSDVIMPQMSGRELARRLREARPALKVLFLSGYADDSLDIRGVLSPGVALLEKPFSRGELARKIREVLGTPEPQG